MTMALKLATGLLLAGWLADTLARSHPEVDAGIDAFRAGQFDEALAAFDRAELELGERPEIHFDRGLALLGKGDTEGAQKALERGSESEDANVRASSLYVLGNLAFDAEDYEGAILRYIEALKARPDHEGAKWNLELALERKRQKEKEDEEEKKDDPPNTDAQDTDQENTDEGTSGGSQNDTSPEPNDTGGTSSGGTDGSKAPESGSSSTGGTTGTTGQPPPEGESSGQPPPPAGGGAAVNQADIDKALEQLDEQDRFQFGRPQGSARPPEKDW